MPDTVIKYEITCKNTKKEKRDIKVTAYLDPQTEFMPANSEPEWREDEQSAVGMTLKGVLPGEERKIILTAAVKKEAKEKIVCRAQIDNAAFLQENPVAGEGSLSGERVPSPSLLPERPSFFFQDVRCRQAPCQLSPAPERPGTLREDALPTDAAIAQAAS